MPASYIAGVLTNLDRIISTESHVRSIRREFDAAFSLVESHRRALDCSAEGESHAGLLAKRAYERATLVYRSCELQLRSAGAKANAGSRRILVYSEDASFRSSIAALLNVWGYACTQAASLCDVLNACGDRPHALVVAYIEPASRDNDARSAALVQAAPALPVLLVASSVVTVQAPAAGTRAGRVDARMVEIPIGRLHAELRQRLRPESPCNAISAPAPETCSPAEAIMPRESRATGHSTPADTEDQEKYSWPSRP